MTRKCGSLSAGIPDSEFNEQEVRKGIEVEKEHTCDLKLARQISKDHLTEDRNYYKKLDRMEKMTLDQMTPNKSSRPRVIESEEIAKVIVKRFNDRPVEYQRNLNFSWPSKLYLVGDSLAIGYSSDKWKTTDAKGKREKELYKHLAESRNKVMVPKGFLYGSNDRPWPVIGPEVSFADVPMPDSVAILGLFEEANLKLHVGGTNDKPKFGSGRDDGLVCVKVRHAYLGGGMIRWSVDDSHEEDQPFLFVYTNDGPEVLMFIIGDELSIEKDGIAG